MKNILVLTLLLPGSLAFAQSPISLKITSHTNLRGNAALETCGTAVHSSGIKPLMVNIKHDESSYTTLTDEAGNWCAIVKRWTNSGIVTASATTLDFKDKTETER